MSVWVLSLVLALFFEGLMISINPSKWQEIMRQIVALPPETLRRMGLGMIATAFFLLLFVLWVQGFSSAG